MAKETIGWHGKYFSLYEMTDSPTAKRLGINNTPSKQIVENLQALVTNVLDPLRLNWGFPIVADSGYRCPRLNRIVGGAKNSQHLYGQAADIRTVSDHPDDNMRLLRCLIESKLPFDKLIAEHVDKQGRPNWIHVSYSPLRRGLMYTTRDGKKYTKGIKV